MHCPNCDEFVYIEDWTSELPFECETCGEWLKLEVDEGTYYGATHNTFVIIDEEDLP